MTTPAKSPAHSVFASITAPRPEAVKVLMWLGVADIVHGIAFSVADAAANAATFVTMMSLMLLEGMLLLMVWQGGRVARGGLVAFQAVMLVLGLLTAAFAPSASSAGTSTFAMVTGLLIAAAVVVAALRGDVSAWLREVAERRKALPAVEQRMLVKATAQLALAWVFAPLLLLKGLGKVAHGEGLGVLVLTAPVVLTGLVVLAVQGWKWLQLRNR